MKVLDPADVQEVATKMYVDKVVNNVGKYVDEKNAYIKSEVDDFTKLLDYVKKSTDERPHIIAVHTHYRGDLIKGAYQFTFGGNVSSELDTGFLVPYSGRIKQIRATNSRGGRKYENFFSLLGGPLFTIITNKPDTGEVSNLLTYKCYITDDPTTPQKFITKFRFKPNPENTPISEGDVINIRTEQGYYDIQGIDDEYISFLFTLLIELDPF